MNDKRCTIIEKLLSEEENVPKISAWVSYTEDGGGAMAMHSYGHEELKKILISQPEEKFKELLYELGVDVDDTTIPPPPGHQHQSLEYDFAEPGTALVVDPNNVPMLPPAHEPGPKECVDCLEREKEISELKDRCRLLEKKLRSSQAANASCRCEIWENKVKNLEMEHQKAQESQEQAASDLKRKGQIMAEKNKEMEKQVTAMRKQIENLKIKNAEKENTIQALQEHQKAQESQEQAASDWKRKGQIMAEKNKDMEKQVMAMIKQIENLKIKNAEKENTIQALQEKSENDLRIINYFRQVMGERKKKIEELEAENQTLQNKEPPDQNE